MDLLKTAKVYLLANIINAVIPFLLIPILTRHMSTSEFGQVAMFQTLIVALSSLVGLNAVGAVNRKYYDEGISNLDMKQYIASSMQVLVMSTILLTLLAIALEDLLYDYLSITYQWAFLAIVVSAGNFICLIRLGQWQIRGFAIRYGILQVGKALGLFLISIVLVVLFEQGANGRVLSQMYSVVLFALVSLFLLYKDDLLSFAVWRRDFVKDILHFGVPLIPHSLSFFLIYSVDRFFIGKIVGIEHVGIYMLAFTVSTVLSVAFDSINKAYVPWLFRKLKEDEHSIKIDIVRKTYLYFLTLIPVVVICFIFGPDFIVFYAGDAYREAGTVIGWLCLGQVFGGMYLMVTNYVFFVKRTGSLSFVTTLCGVINVILLLALLPSYGIAGAAYSFASSRLLQFLFTLALSVKVAGIPWFYLREICKSSSSN